MKNWYLVMTKPRKEVLAKENLIRQNYVIYMPFIQENRRRRGNWIEVIAPLFPRYLFVQLEVGRDNFSSIKYTTGIQDLVRFSDEPAIVPNHVVDTLKIASDSNDGIYKGKQPLFTPGDLVLVESGPFAGVQAIFEAETAQERVIILLDILGRQNRIVVNRNLLCLA